MCSPVTRGAKYSLLAYTTLGLPDADSSFQSHSLIVYQDGKWMLELLLELTDLITSTVMRDFAAIELKMKK